MNTPKEEVAKLLSQGSITRAQLRSELRGLGHNPRRASDIVTQAIKRGQVEENDGAVSLVELPPKGLGLDTLLMVKTVRTQTTVSAPDPTTAIMDVLREGCRFIVVDDGQELCFQVFAHVTEVKRV